MTEVRKEVEEKVEGQEGEEEVLPGSLLKFENTTYDPESDSYIISEEDLAGFSFGFISDKLKELDSLTDNPIVAEELERQSKSLSVSDEELDDWI